MATTPPKSDYAFPAAIKRVTWGAILAGAVVALVLQLMLNLLGLAIGLSTIDLATEANPISGIGVGAGIWFVLTTLLALAAGGFVAGRLAGLPRKADGMIHGFISWAIVTFFSIYLLSSGIGAVLGGAFTTVSRGVETLTEGIQTIGQDVDLSLSTVVDLDVSTDVVQTEVLEALQQSGIEELQPAYLREQGREALRTLRQGLANAALSPEDARQELQAAIDDVVAQGEQIVNAIDREAAVNVVVERTDLTEAEAREAVDTYIEEIEETYAQVRQRADDIAQTLEERATEVADEVLDATAGAAFWSFFAMLIGAAAGAAGGAAGTPADLPASPAVRRE